MDRYKYSISLNYLRDKKGISQPIDSKNIKSIIIDRDYINTNMPVIFMNINLDKRLIDDMIKNQDRNTMVLTIFKYIYREDKLLSNIKYVHSKMMYFIKDDLNYKDSLDFSEEENREREDISKIISIGLMGLDAINNNKRSYNTILKNTTMINAVHHCTSHMDMVLEKFDHNKNKDLIEELLIKPQTSVSKVISYLNGIKVFYKTPYRFFIDFDCAYLLSSSGKAVPKKGESIHDILIIVRDPLHPQAMNSGMITNYKEKCYQIDVSASDTQLIQNKITEKVYTSVSTISEQGQSNSVELRINKSKNSNNKTELIRIPGSNPNMIENILAAEEQKSSHLVLNKMDTDLTIFTPNKRYEIRNYDGHKDRDGDFILTRKRDLFYLESEDMFAANVMLEFDQVVKK